MQKTTHPTHELARSALEAMRAANTLDQVEEHWKEFLRRLERSWNKVSAHYSKSPKWSGWSSKYERLRRTDELLIYLTNARGAEEHTVNEITEKTPGSIGINPASGNSLYIERLIVMNGMLDIKSPMPLRIDVKQPRMSLLPVTNRGRTYPVPCRHLGGTVDSDDIVAMGESALNFYQAATTDAEKFFVK